jgi:predicted nucleic acid-binding protein
MDSQALPSRRHLYSTNVIRGRDSGSHLKGHKDPQLARKEVAQLHRFNARGVLRLTPVNTTIIRGATALATDYGLRVGDAIYAALAQQLGIALVTFDIELLSLPGTIISTIRP